MTSFDLQRSQYRGLCADARTFVLIAEQTIFAKITALTNPSQFAACRQHLDALCRRLEAKLDLFHYPAAFGTYTCIRDTYEDCVSRLELLASMQPPLALPLPPRQQLITREGIVIDLEERIQTSTTDTYLGTDGIDPADGSAGC